ncbi:MAG: pyridoxal-phosphate dependent enzyme [Metallosphaera prunae]|uniref:pyridoxal-phosphate dependent enzyme n=1 Tax=Metallosphaera prunae TaxID=47304 RepID=UPI002274F19A|nr:pyridoxal-phosphate dependent enzyme [Metallosphaera prunae]MCY0862687.1 pyridoxal-phosphate dependent enzyme [Metallosphaera prunae]
MRVKCIKCGREREGIEVRCKCGGIFKVEVDTPFSKNLRENFPYVKKWISLGEWNTPSIRIEGFTYKLDFLNPTGSYKDRGSVTLISHLSQLGIKEISEDSSGNAGSSIAAYGAMAGMKVKVFVPSTARGGKLKQIETYGAEVVKVEGTRDDVSRAAENSGAYYASHVLQPEFRDGIRSLAYEIARDHGWKSPGEVFLPTSAGTLLLGVYEGFRHMVKEGILDKIPKLVAVQTEQVSPVCSKFNGLEYRPPSRLTSIADALVSTNPVLMDEMIRVLQETGDCVVVSENEIMDSWKYLSTRGILAEYSSAVALAGARKYELTDPVIVLTGNGLKIL